jgi:hypothetical protein
MEKIYAKLEAVEAEVQTVRAQNIRLEAERARI